MDSDGHNLLDDTGFSFLELVISLVVLSLLSLALMWSLHIGIQTWDKLTKDPDAQADVYFAQNALRLFMSSAHVDGNGAKAQFEGEADNLVLVARMPEQFGYGGDYKIVIKALKRADGQTDLVILPSLYADRVESPVSAPETVVLHNVKALAFRYFGTPTLAQSPGWYSSWNDQTSLPRLISLDVSFSDASKRFWPTLLVAPKLSGVTVP